MTEVWVQMCKKQSGEFFLNVARVETYVKRVIYIELLNGKLWFRHPRSSVGERRVFDPTGPKVLQNPGGKRVLFW